jgi:ABC-2 type transport system ATP-binding protein
VAENLTVKEHLEFMASLYLEKERIAGAVSEAVKAFGLEEFVNKKAKHLSGGWKRKLSIAMAIIGEPKILFLDEPTLGLDVLARRKLWTEIEALKSRMTIVLTTHYMEEAEALADRIFVMIDGRIAAEGTLNELENRTGKKGLEEVFIKIAEEGK